MSWGGRKPSELSMKSVVVFFSFLPKHQLKACLLSLQGFPAFRLGSGLFSSVSVWGKWAVLCHWGFAKPAVLLILLESVWQKHFQGLSGNLTFFFSGAAHLLLFSLCWFTGYALLLMSYCSCLTHWLTEPIILCCASLSLKSLAYFLASYPPRVPPFGWVLNLSDKLYYCIPFALPVVCFVIEDFRSWEWLIWA